MESSLVTVLSTLFSGRVFPDTAPFGTAAPYCIYQQVGGRPIQFLSGGSGTGRARIQIFVWADTRADALSLIRQSAQLVAGAPLYASIESESISQYEAEQRIYGSRQDFMIQY